MYIHLKDGTGRLIVNDNAERELRDMLEEYCGREALDCLDYVLDLKTDEIEEELRREYEECGDNPEDID